MSFAVSASVIGGVAIAGATVYAGYQQSQAAQNAADAQSQSAQAQLQLQQRQYDQTRQDLMPYNQAGQSALSAQQDLLGLNGGQSQQSAIDQVQNSPLFQSLLQQGNTNLLQNAAATGGLRGGNTQAALAQYSPQLLNQLLTQKFSELGSLSSLGQNSAAQTGAYGQQNVNAQSNALEQMGAAQAGGYLAQGQQATSVLNGLTNGIGAGLALYKGL